MFRSRLVSRVAALVVLLAEAAYAPAGAGSADGGGFPSDGSDLADELGVAVDPDLAAEADADPSSGWAAQELLRELMREAAALRRSPLDVNTASLSQLLRVPFLDPATAASILAFRGLRGPVSSLDELAAWIGEPGLVESLRPYLVARPLRVPSAANDGGSHAGEAAPSHQVPTVARAAPPAVPAVRWNLRLRGSSRANPADDWAVDSLDGVGRLSRLYGRFRASHESGFSLGLACERDPGEERLLDHTALFARWETAARERVSRHGRPWELSAVVGDLTGSWAQGIVLRPGGMPSADAFPLARDRVRGYDGAGEAVGRRGVAVAVSRARARAYALWAATALDATIDDRGLASSIRTSGYHRTPGERSAADALTETVLGGRVVFEARPGVEVGASGLRFGFDPALAEGDPERQRFRFHGSELVVCALDARIGEGDRRVAAEAAWCSMGGRAALATGRLRRRHASVRAGLGFASREYWCPLGGGMPGVSGGTNGSAAWLGLEYGPRAKWATWVDVLIARPPWRSYHQEVPNTSRAVTVGTEVALGRLGRFEAESRSRRRAVEIEDPASTGTRVERTTKLSLRTEGASCLTLSWLAATSDLCGVREGALTALGAAARAPLGADVALSAGITSATERGDVPGVVVYEPRLPGEFALRSLNRSGTRWYIRFQTGLSTGGGVTARLAGGPLRGQVELGIGLDVAGRR